MARAPFALENPQRRRYVSDDCTPRRPGPNPRRLLLFALVGLADCFLILAYWPSLADSLESWVFIQPPSPSPPALRLPPDQNPKFPATPGIDRPPTLPADKAVLDADSPVIGILASGQARAYLLEAFKHGPASHIVNDLLGNVPISVTHCDISGCTRAFTGATPGRPLGLSVVDIRNHQMVLKLDGHLYSQETSESLDTGGTALPCREYPAELTVWSVWRQAHPKTDVYMGTIDEPTPPEAGGPRLFSPHKPSSGTLHTH